MRNRSSRAVVSLVVLLAAGTIAACTPPTGTPTEPTIPSPLQPQVAAGGSHSCAVRPTGDVVCWGANESGQIGDGTNGAARTPRPVFGLVSARSVDAGSRHSCAVRPDRSAVCWGDNSYGQLGTGNTNDSWVPTPVQGLSNVEQITAGFSHTCARKVDGSVLCWGSNSNGELGTNNYADAWVPQPVSGITNASALSVGSSASCAIQSGQVVCWGTDADQTSTVPVPREGIVDARSVEVGDAYTCALDSSAALHCWSLWSSLFSSPGGMQNVKAFGTGGSVVCAVRQDNSAACWGGGSQRGTDTPIRYIADEFDRSIPETVTGLTDASRMTVGGTSACATTTSGLVRCWGRNDQGQVGTGTVDFSVVPSKVPEVNDAAGLSVGPNHTCIATQAEPVCWGAGESGQIGDGQLWRKFLPTTSLLPSASQVDSGHAHSCAVRASGSVWCWGSNSAGQMGNEDINDGIWIPGFGTPREVLGLNNVLEVSAGWEHTCARLSSGTVSCWGNDNSGQVGNGAPADWYTAPQVVTGLSGVSDLATGGEHSCGVRSNGTVACWGANALGQLGTGSTAPSTTPATVVGLAGVLKVEADGGRTCAVKADGTVWCWGGGSTTPSQVGGVDGATDVAVGHSANWQQNTRHTCALLIDGSIRCWGDNVRGQLGNGLMTWLSEPAVPAVPAAVEIDAGGQVTCARTTSDEIWCWGDNVNGQVGNGVRTDIPQTINL